MGIMETILAAVAEAMKKAVGRKNLVAIVAMCLLAAVPALPLAVCGLITAIACTAIVTQWWLDTYEVAKLGKDQPDNGNGGEHGEVDLGDTVDDASVDPGAIGTNEVGA